MELSQGKQENLLKNLLEEPFKKLGYAYKHEYANTLFRKIENNILYQLEIQSTSQGLGFTKHMLSIFSVEDIIIEIGKPFVSMDPYKKKENFFSTVLNKKTELLSFNDNNTVKTESDCRLFADEIIQFMNNEGKLFVEKYSYLPNVLGEMDRLENEGKDWNEILGGMGDRLFRGLIISKLCNDPNYKKKQKFCDNKFNTINLLKDWIPYYEKLKDRLNNLNPIYNI